MCLNITPVEERLKYAEIFIDSGFAKAILKIESHKKQSDVAPGVREICLATQNLSMVDCYLSMIGVKGDQKCLAHLKSFLWSARTAVSAAKRLSHSPGTGGKYVRFRGQKVRRRVRLDGNG
jgi:hypothetical protein